MKKILFTLCIAAILIASYKIGLKTGEFKAFPDGYWQGMEDDLYYWKTLTLKKLNGRWTKFYETSKGGGVHYDAFKSDYMDYQWKNWKEKENAALLKSFGSGVTLPEFYQ